MQYYIEYVEILTLSRSDLPLEPDQGGKPEQDQPSSWWVLDLAYDNVNHSAKTLKNFYLASLDDFDALLPALEALQVLSKLTSFDGDDAVEVYRQ